MMRAPVLQIPSGGLGLAKPPPLGIARPTSVGGRGKSDTLKVKQTWTGVTTPSVWEIKGDDLEPVPLDFPLERTHRTIEGSDAAEVAKRISEALRSHSIEAEYGRNPVKAKCKTNDFVSFRIRLYAGGEDGNPVVVEIQRRSGSATSFMKSCRAILAAAEGKSEEASRRTVPPFMKKPIGQMKCLRSISVPGPSAASAADDAIAHAVLMIRSDKKDANSLGLENLLSLTDPIKTSYEIAVAVSKCVVLGDEKYDIRDDVRAFAERDMFDEEDVAISQHAERVRHLALTVFANGLALCTRDGCLGNALQEQAWFKEHFMSSLVDELKLCESSAACALQAARCIASLVESSASARRFLDSCNVTQALEDARVYGKAQHDLLAEETARCLKLLNVV